MGILDFSETIGQLFMVPLSQREVSGFNLLYPILTIWLYKLSFIMLKRDNDSRLTIYFLGSGTPNINGVSPGDSIQMHPCSI